MAIKRTAYDTLACNGFKLADILNNLTKAHGLDGLDNKEFFSSRTDMAFSYSLVKSGNSFSDNIKHFAHPIIFNTVNKDDKGQYIKQFALDIRNFGRWDKNEDKFIIRSHPQYQWAVNRLILNNYWLTDAPELLRDMSALPAKVYAALISDSLTKRFALDPKTQYTIAIISCYFYYCLFTDYKEMSDNEYDRSVSGISKTLKQDATFVYDVLDSLEKRVLNDLDDFAQAIKDITQNVSLDKINKGILVSLTCNSWIGDNARELVAVGLEHPPTWISIVNGACTESTYKRSLIAKIAGRFSKDGAFDQLEKSFSSLVFDDN